MSKALATCCNTVLESKHRHDFVTCKCGDVSLDGGDDYIRVVGNYSVLKFEGESKEEEQ